MTQEPTPERSLQRSLETIVGEAHVITDEEERRYYSGDLYFWDDACPAEIVVQPGSTEEVAAVVRCAVEAGRSLIARGGAMSYTKGHVPERPHAVLVDLRRLDGIYEINAEDLYVSVGSGCTWARLAGELARHGLRIGLVTPISGLYATVGGTLAQNMPGSMDPVLGVEVVLADGSVVHTGSAARGEGASPFFRGFGPDLTGLFLGDSDALGIKTGATLRVVPDAPADFASFAFESFLDLVETAAEIARHGLVSRAFGFDPLKSRTSTKVDLAEGARIVGAVAASAGSVTRALRDTFQVIRAGRDVMADVKWSLHLTAEGATERIARERIAAAGAICRRKGREIENVVPKALRARPYSVRGFLGLSGERWVPIHGIFPLSMAESAALRLQDFFAGNRALMERHGIEQSYVVSSSGPYINLEPMFYWSDEVGELHLRHLSERHRARFAGHQADPQARAVVDKLRNELRELLPELGAVHVQIAKYYTYVDALEPGTRALISTLKRALDPHGVMNPGALGLP